MAFAVDLLHSWELVVFLVVYSGCYCGKSQREQHYSLYTVSLLFRELKIKVRNDSQHISYFRLMCLVHKSVHFNLFHTPNSYLAKKCPVNPQSKNIYLQISASSIILSALERQN